MRSCISLIHVTAQRAVDCIAAFQVNHWFAIGLHMLHMYVMLRVEHLKNSIQKLGSQKSEIYPDFIFSGTFVATPSQKYFEVTHYVAVRCLCTEVISDVLRTSLNNSF